MIFRRFADKAGGRFSNVIFPNIFGEHDFYNDKSKDGSLTLKPGETWRFRYRVVIHPGDNQSAGIAKIYDDYLKKAKK